MQKILMKILGIVLGVAAILGLDWAGVHYYEAYTINPIKVPVAAHDIMPRTMISADDISYVTVPAVYVNEVAYMTERDIVGMYTDIQGKIPEGSLFYRTMLHEPSSLPDYPHTKLKEGQVAYTLNTDAAHLGGNSIMADQRVDLYVSLKNENGSPLVDCLVRNARVLGIRDQKGYEISDPESTRVPAVILLALDEDCVRYLGMARMVGTIEIVVPSDTYADQEAALVSNSRVIPYLKVG